MIFIVSTKILYAPEECRYAQDWSPAQYLSRRFCPLNAELNLLYLVCKCVFQLFLNILQTIKDAENKDGASEQDLGQIEKFRKMVSTMAW